MSGLELEEKPL